MLLHAGENFHALGRDAVRNQRQRRLGFVRNLDRRAQRVLAAFDAGAIAREHGREWLARFNPISGPRGDHEAD